MSEEPSGTKDRDEEKSPPDPVDEADEESFPASDPPAWGPLHSGPPIAPPPKVTE